MAALLVVAAVPAGAVRISNAPLVNTVPTIYQAYAGFSIGQNAFAGYNGLAGDPISAVPGVLSIIPGGPKWNNFVAPLAGGQGPTIDPALVTIKDVQLTKLVPATSQCNDVFGPVRIVQHGTPSIRTWWPLMYEVPGTSWQLVVSYGTAIPYKATAEAESSYFHQNIWTWTLGADVTHLRYLVWLFHELPYGKCEVPLISDELLYTALLANLDAIENAPDAAAAALALGDFELLVSDNCVAGCPPSPIPPTDGSVTERVAGYNLGIVGSPENPACCKLLVDAGYIFANSVGIAGK
jgi:hypothetical protein